MRNAKSAQKMKAQYNENYIKIFSLFESPSKAKKNDPL